MTILPRPHLLQALYDLRPIIVSRFMGGASAHTRSFKPVHPWSPEAYWVNLRGAIYKILNLTHPSIAYPSGSIERQRYSALAHNLNWAAHALSFTNIDDIYTVKHCIWTIDGAIKTFKELSRESKHTRLTQRGFTTAEATQSLDRLDGLSGSDPRDGEGR